jgi:hypothetical protein
MKSRMLIAGIVAAGAAISLTTLWAADEAKPTPAMRIGVYDSRCIALAYGRSEAQLRSVRTLREDYEKAKANSDEKRIKELEQEGPWGQVRLHQQVFSTAGVRDIMARVSDALPAIAREAGVPLIVSKWEMPYKDASVETVDLTVPIAKLFKPDDRTLKMIDQMKAQEPVPFDKLPLDPKL